MLALYFVLSLFSIFYIPYFFPVPPSTSESYIFGYSNRVGIILLLLLVSTGAIWTRSLNLDFSANGHSSKIPLKYLWISLAVEFAACACMYHIAGSHCEFSEAEQQINRVWLASIGKRPYLDFEWPWGPFFLYVPRWASALLHLTIPHAYFLFWVLASLLGIALLFATINLVDFPSTRKTSIFALFFLFAMLAVPNMGTNYTMVRYLCPTLFIIIVYRVSGQVPQPGRQLRAAALCVLFTATLLMISPEVTIAFACACMVLLFLRNPSSINSVQVLAYLATIAILAILFFSAYRAHFLDALIMDGHGGNSFPIMFAPPTLLFFGAIFICACYVVQRNSQNGIHDNTAALIAFAVPMLAAALGRADPGHMVLNGIGFFIAVFFYASNSPRMWRFCRNAFVIFFLILPPLPGLLVAVYSFTRPSPPSFPTNADVSALYPKGLSYLDDGIFEAPFGYLPDAKGFYFSPQIDYGFYDNLWDATTPDSYRTKIEELAQHPRRALLIRHGVLGVCEIHEWDNRVKLGTLLAFPYTARAVHRESVRKPLCDYILDHYIPSVPGTPRNFQYELWRPNT